MMRRFGDRLSVSKIKRLPSGHLEADIDIDKDLYEQIRQHVHAEKSDAGDDDVNLFLEQVVANALQNAARQVSQKKD